MESDSPSLHILVFGLKTYFKLEQCSEILDGQKGQMLCYLCGAVSPTGALFSFFFVYFVISIFNQSISAVYI